MSRRRVAGEMMRKGQMLLVSIGFALLGGLFFLSRGQAAQFSIQFEGEQGTAVGSAPNVIDPAASGGMAVRFAPRPPSGFIYVCGRELCLDDQPFRLHGGTTYGQLSNPANEVALAKQARLNILEIVEYETRYRDLTDTTSEATWTRIDNFIAVAKQNGLHIILNLSSYGHALRAAGVKPTTTDWGPFLSFVTNRTNTVTGIKYKDEPAIAMFELLGEIDAPNYNVPMRGTTAETTEFYRRSLAQLRALDDKHLMSTGGFSYINDPGSGIDWRTISADPNNDVCAVEINSFADRNISVPNMSDYCKTLNKPWFLAAWSSCYRPGGPEFNGDANSWRSDTEMAAHAQDMYNITLNNFPTAPGPAVKAAGTDFWNLGPTGACDVGPAFPQTLSTVQANAP